MNAASAPARRGPRAPRRWHRPRRVGLATAVAMALCPVAIAHAGRDAHERTNITRHLDVRQAEGHPDRLGLDFDLRYERQRGDSIDLRNSYALLAVVRGFQTFDRAIPDANSMTVELDLQGTYFPVDLTPLTPVERKRHEELSARSEIGDPSNPPLERDEQEELDALGDKLDGRPAALWTYDLHYRAETNHDVSRSQSVFGVGGAFEVPVLHQILDLLPSALRELGTDAPDGSAPARWHPQPVRLYAAAEYVAPTQDSVLAFASGRVDRLWRVRLESAWKTRVLAGADLRAEARLDWLPDAPDLARDAGREVNGFVQAWLLYPLKSGSAAALMVKYFDGRLPPEYAPVSGGKVGLTIDLVRH